MKKGRRFTTILLVIIILAGLSLLLYPTVSDYINSITFHEAIIDYRSRVEDLDRSEYERIMADARAYNEELARRSVIVTSLDDEQREVYNSMLDVTGTGIMGYIEIPKINISLPIYHGATDAVLQSGVGHLEGSSLPIGGEGTHALLSAHRGLPSAKLFTNIDQLVEGDVFTVRVMNEAMTYEVDQITVVLPYEVENLRIEPDQDYCTLITCTPYGVNSHRLLVRGHRIETPAGDTPLIDNQRMTINPYTWSLTTLLIVLGSILVLIIVTVIVIVKLRRKNGVGKPKARYAKAKHRKGNKNHSPDVTADDTLDEELDLFDDQTKDE